MELETNDSLSDIAYGFILERIISFDYRPNEPIIENDICQILNISRTPLREALRRLEAEGFVVKMRNRGTFVRTYTEEDIIESCEARNLFELYALQNCIKSVNKEELSLVKEKLMSLKESDAEKQYYESDAALHRMITRYCMNSRIQAFLKSLRVQLDAVQKISAQTPNRLLQSRKEHLEIVVAIEEKDFDKASGLLKVHLENVQKSCVEAFHKIRLDKLNTR